MRLQVGTRLVNCSNYICDSYFFVNLAPFTGSAVGKLGAHRSFVLSGVLCCIVNCVLGVVAKASPSGPSFSVVVFLYCLNISCQGFGTAAVLRINSTWYTRRERGLFSGVFNVVIMSGRVYHALIAVKFIIV